MPLAKLINKPKNIIIPYAMLLAVFAAFFSIPDLKAQDKNEALGYINTIALPLQTEEDDQSININSNTFQLFFKDSDLIGLGESTHGTKEFNVYRDQIIRSLINYGSVKTIIFETDYCRVEKLNQLLLNGTGDSLPRTFTGLYGVWKTEEVYNMLDWIYKYNRTAKVNEKIQVRGADMQDPFSITQTILDSISNLSKLNPSSLKSLNQLNLLYKPAKEVKHSKADIIAFKAMIKDLYALVDQEKNSEHKQYIRLLEQTISIRETKNFSQYKTLRDKYLAENVMFIYKKKPQNSKVILWAHNGHIAHANVSMTDRMGRYLKNELGNKYYALALAFNSGASRIFDFKGTPRGYKNFNYSASLKTNSLESLLQKIDHPAFILDLATVQKHGNATRLLEKAKYMRVIGATYEKNDSGNYFLFPVFECFDGILFFQKASAAEGIVLK